MNYCSDSLHYKLIQEQFTLSYSLPCIVSFHFVLVIRYSNVILYCGCELYPIPTYIPVELQIKYEHSNRNLECLNKLSAPIAVQHLYAALLSVLKTHYCIP